MILVFSASLDEYADGCLSFFTLVVKLVGTIAPNWQRESEGQAMHED